MAAACARLLARLLALLPALCLALAAADREEWYTAFVNFTYTDPMTGRVRTERSEYGRYGEQSPKREARGVLAAAASPRERHACRPGTRFAVPEHTGTWIALVAHGNCTYAEKIRHAAGQNASAVVVMNAGTANGNETITMPHPGTGDVVAIMMPEPKGRELVLLLERNITVQMHITIGTRNLQKFVIRTSVVFVSISFIILMIISLALLAFCYIQRFRYANARDRNQVGPGIQVMFSLEEGNGKVFGSLYPTSMRINEEGRLVVTFRTEAGFRGLFILSHSGEFAAGRQWYVHVVYTVRSSKRNDRHTRSLRSKDQYHHSVAPSTFNSSRLRTGSLRRRAADEAEDELIGQQSGHGTNLQPIGLQRAPSALQVPSREEAGLDWPAGGASLGDSEETVSVVQAAALAVAGLVCLTGVTAFVWISRRRRTETTKKHTHTVQTHHTHSYRPHTHSGSWERRRDTEDSGNSEV